MLACDGKRKINSADCETVTIHCSEVWQGSVRLERLFQTDNAGV